MLHTVTIDHEEGFWPRYLSQTAIERNAFFSSSDVGVAGVLTLPKKWGELYATVANGAGYGQTEQDPYKDYSARLSLTPFGSSDGFLKAFTISPWFYMGKTASKFINGGAGQVGAVTDGLNKNRAGVFIGVRDRRLTAGLDWAQRTETNETGANTAASPRVAFDNTGTLTGAWASVRPFEIFADDPKMKSPLSLFFRFDNLKPFSDQRAASGTQTTSSNNTLIIAGGSWDINSKATFSVDYQDLTPNSGSSTLESKILFVHFLINF